MGKKRRDKMDDKLFRKKSLTRVSSPEELNDYLRVSNPGMWMILGAIIILLLGFCIWGIFGRLETRIISACEVEDGVITCYVKEEEVEFIRSGMLVRIDGEEAAVDVVGYKPIMLTDELDEYGLHFGNFKQGDWVCAVTLKDIELDEGMYKAVIIVDSVSPLSFITN